MDQFTPWLRWRVCESTRDEMAQNSPNRIATKVPKEVMAENLTILALNVDNSHSARERMRKGNYPITVR